MSTTDRHEAVLAEAQNTARRLGPQAAKQAAAALAILRRQGRQMLEVALRLDPPAGANAKHWADFRRVVTPDVVRRIADDHGDEGLALLLGWIKRLGAINEGAAPPPGRGGRRRPR